MDDSLYDEFGNYIGPELSESEEVRRVRGWLLADVAAGRAEFAGGRAVCRAPAVGPASIWMSACGGSEELLLAGEIAGL